MDKIKEMLQVISELNNRISVNKTKQKTNIHNSVNN